MQRVVPVEKTEDIYPQYRDTPIGRLLEYHNLGRSFDAYPSADLLIGMCMDNRKSLHLPDNFAFVLRSGGANLRYSDFQVSFAISIGGIKSIALIGHTQCGMAGLNARKENFVEGMIKNAGWTREIAEEHFLAYSSFFEIGNPVDFTLNEAYRLRHRYPKILVAPLIYKVEDNRLYLLPE